MNQAHIHLLLNHIPIIFPGLGLLIMLIGYLFSSEPIKRTAYLIFIMGAFFTIPAFLTGEGAEEILEDIQGIDMKYIKTHEHVANTFSILNYILGGISVIGIWLNWKEHNLSRIVGMCVVALSLLVLIYAKQAGLTGGAIRHIEIRSASIN